jgi:hypothetical protein
VPAVAGDHRAEQVLLVAQLIRMVPGLGYLRVDLRRLVGPGLKGGEDLGCGVLLGVLLLCLLFLSVAFEHLVDQEGDGAFALCGFADFGGWG